VFEPVITQDSGKLVQIHVEGQVLRVRGGVSLAVALMESKIVPLRHTPISGAPRAPLCLMGTCFECLCEVNGRQNVQACMVEVTEGMRVRLAKGARRTEVAT
jgi:D-hydroxyproline dehydrogenase subunit gamma